MKCIVIAYDFDTDDLYSECFTGEDSYNRAFTRKRELLAKKKNMQVITMYDAEAHTAYKNEINRVRGY